MTNSCSRPSREDQARNRLLFLRDLEWHDDVVQAKRPRRFDGRSHSGVSCRAAAPRARHALGLDHARYGNARPRMLPTAGGKTSTTVSSDYSLAMLSIGPRDHSPRQGRQTSVRPPRASAAPASTRPQSRRGSVALLPRLCQEEPKCRHGMGVAMGLSCYAAKRSPLDEPA